MRPLSLTLHGFRSYATKSEFDLRNQRLLGIVGPIGSGKSSILDGVAFALYGMTPTERASTKSLIHQRADAARVELVFESDDHVWRVVRALRRAGQSEHALYRYPSDEAFQRGDPPTETVVKKGEVDDRIEQLLGLDFAAFNRSVLLAQGRFAELLRATPTQRDEVLKGVFGFDLVGRMERLAKLRRDTAAREVEQVGEERASLDQVRKRLETAEVAEARAAARNSELEAIAPKVAAQTERAAELIRRVEAAEERLEELENVRTQLPERATTEKVLEVAAEAIRQGTELDEEAAEARRRAQAAAQALADQLDTFGGEAALARAVALVSEIETRKKSLEETRRRIVGAEADLAEAVPAHRQAIALLDRCVDDETAALSRQAEAEASLSAAETARHAAQHADMASALRSELEAGQACPVCAQTIHELPERTEVDLTVSERALDAARSALREATAAARATAQRHAGAAKDVDSAAAAISRAEQTLTDLTRAHESEAAAVEALSMEARGLLGGGDPASLLKRKQHDLAGLREAAQESARLADDAQRRADAARSGAAESMAELEDIAAKLHRLAGRLGDDVVVGRTPDEVRSALDRLRTRWSESQADAARAKDETQEDLVACYRTKTELLAGVGLDAGSDFVEAKSAAQAELAALSAEIQLHRERLDAAADLLERVAAAESKLELFRALAAELTPSRFLNFLLREERAVLSELGSHRFEQLSAGRYRFTDDGEFGIVDLTAAEQVRRADTLSGGETFLASLALALGLAEIVTRGGGRLDALFLDEGFGSLDSEHLDLAMSGIERLVTDHEDRLVVIVSHVPEMRDRLEELIMLDKDPATGSTVVLQAPGGA